MPDWLSDLPGVPYSPLVDDFTVDEAFLPPVATDMYAGNTRMRQSFTVDVQIESVRINIGTAAQLDDFLQWVKDDLVRGTQKFTMPVPYNNSVETRTCMIIGGGGGIQIMTHGLNNYVVMFKRRVEFPFGE